MKPWIHAENSAKKHGGKPEDYLPIHDFMDSTKAAYADVRHRAILHNSFGIYLAEKVFGTYIEVGDKKIQVRDIAEQHVIEDMGFIPTLQDWLKGMPRYEWNGPRTNKVRKKIGYDGSEETPDTAHID